MRLNFQVTCFLGQKSVFRRCSIQNVKDGIQIQVYNINNESVNQYNLFISVKVKKHLRKSQTPFREKLRKLKLRQNNDFIIKKVYLTYWKRTKKHTLSRLL